MQAPNSESLPTIVATARRCTRALLVNGQGPATGIARLCPFRNSLDAKSAGRGRWIVRYIVKGGKACVADRRSRRTDIRHPRCIKPLHELRTFLQTHRGCGTSRLDYRVFVASHSNRSKDTHNQDHDHDLDQCESAIFPRHTNISHHSLLTNSRHDTRRMLRALLFVPTLIVVASSSPTCITLPRNIGLLGLLLSPSPETGLPFSVSPVLEPPLPSRSKKD